MYPTTEEKQKIASMIIQEYPFLADSIGAGTVSNFCIDLDMLELNIVTQPSCLVSFLINSPKNHILVLNPYKLLTSLFLKYIDNFWRVVLKNKRGVLFISKN